MKWNQNVKCVGYSYFARKSQTYLKPDYSGSRRVFYRPPLTYLTNKKYNSALPFWCTLKLIIIVSCRQYLTDWNPNNLLRIFPVYGVFLAFFLIYSSVFFFSISPLWKRNCHLENQIDLFSIFDLFSFDIHRLGFFICLFNISFEFTSSVVSSFLAACWVTC